MTGIERRREPRLPVAADVQLLVGDEIQEVLARNLSVGGIYVAADPEAFPTLLPGTQLDVVVSWHGTSIRCPARIARRDPGDPGRRPPGIGIVFEEIDPESLARLRALIVRASREQGAPTP